jgi:hypothetical protein
MYFDTIPVYDGLAIREEFAMEISRAEQQPQDPVAARLGIYMFYLGVAVAAALAASSFLRG